MCALLVALRVAAELCWLSALATQSPATRSRARARTVREQTDLCRPCPCSLPTKRPRRGNRAKSLQVRRSGAGDGFTPTGRPGVGAPTSRSGCRWPVFELYFRHREVINVGSRQRSANADSRRSDQAVSLMQCRAAVGKLTSPRPGPDALSQPQGSKPQAVEEAPHRRLLGWTDSPRDLLDRDDTNPRLDARSAQPGDPRRRGPTAKCIYQGRGIEEESAQLSRRGARRSYVALGPMPPGRRPSRARSRRARRELPRCRPSAAGRPGRV
jgi:hypothetical protein